MDNITYLDVPSTERGFPMPKWRLNEIERYRHELNDPTKVYFVGEVRHWRSNDAVVPLSVFKDGYMVPCAAHVAAYEADLVKDLEAYRKARSGPPSDEEIFEMRAAFGPGVEVVDVISGRRVRT